MQRLNTKFLILVIAIVGVTVGVVGLGWAYVMLSNPERNIARGRELEQQGDYLAAMRAYGRAVAKRRSNPEYLDHMQRALLKIVPPTAEEARQHYEMNLQLLRQRARINPEDPEPWKRLMEAFEERAHFLQSPAAWQQLAEVAQEMLREVPRGSDGERYARSIAAIATAQREGQLSESEREELERTLREAVSADPKDAQAWNALLGLLLNDANRTFMANQVNRSRERLSQFKAALEEAEAAVPDSATIPLAKARFIRSQVNRDEISVAEALAQLAPVLDELETSVLGRDVPPATIVAAVDQLLATSNPVHAAKAVGILDRWLEVHPDDLVMQRLLSIALRRYDLDRSIAVAQKIIDTPRSTVSLRSAFHNEVRAESAERIFDIEIARAEGESDAAKRAEHLQMAERMRDLIAELGRDQEHNARLLKVEARLALFHGDRTGAASKIERVLSLVDNPDLETYLLAAEISLQRNEYGQGLKYIERGLDRLGASYPLLMARARIELAMRRGSEAAKTAEVLLKMQPDDPMATQILAEANRMVEAASPAGATDPIILGLQESERRLAAQDVEGARAVIDRMLAEHGTDSRILGQAGRLDIIAGESERAIERLDRALQIAPNDSILKQLRAIAETNDPVERVDKLIEMNVADPAERPVVRYAMLTSSIVALNRDLAGGGRTFDGKMRDVDELRKTLARFEAELPAAREAALAAGGSVSNAIATARFDEAVLARDFEAAERVGIEVEQKGDRAFGAFLRARALSLQNRHREAQEHLEKQIQQGVVNADMLLQLGYARESQGDVVRALQAYKEAYDRRPGDLATLSAYADLLRRTGELPRALQIYRDAARSALGDRRLVNAWLRLEDAIGDRSVALCWRRKLYREVASDRENALLLAAMLTDGTADHRLIIDDDCQAKYTDLEWNSLPVASRQQEIQAMLRKHQAEGTEIFRQLLRANPADFEAAMYHAQMLVRLGQKDEAEKLLRDVVAKAPPEQSGPMWFGLGQFLGDLGLNAKALEAFEQARAFQDPVQREADLALCDFWFTRQQWQRAHDALKEVLDVQPNPAPALMRRMAEILIKLRRVDEAEQFIARAREADGSDRFEAVYDVLRSNIATIRGEDLWTAGDRAGAQREFDKAEAALRRAIDLQPGSAIPWYSLAALHRDMYLRTRDQAMLKKARESVERGFEMASTQWAGVMLYANILQEMGDLAGATLVIERYLEVAPANIEARKHLADLYLQAGNAQRAINVLGEGAILQPNDPVWPLAIGELQIRRGAFREAIASFDRALQIAPSPMVLGRAIDARQRVTPPDWRGIIDLARQFRPEVHSDPAMRSAFAAALYNTGDRQSGLQLLREVGTQLRKDDAVGRARTGDMDAWYAALRHVFPVTRTEELDEFLHEVAGTGGLNADEAHRLAMLWTETGPTGYPNVTKYLEEARRHMDSQDARYRSRVWLATGNLEYVMGNCEAAISAFEKVIEEDPGNPQAINNLAYLLSHCRNEHAKAVEYARRSVAAGPGQADFLDTLGYVLFRNGEYAEAQTVLERAIRVLPLPSTYLHLAQVLAATDRKEDALAALGKAEALNPPDDVRGEIDALRRSLN